MALLKIKDTQGNWEPQGNVGVFSNVWEEFATFTPSEDTASWEIGSGNYDASTQLKNKGYKEVMIVGSITGGGNNTSYGNLSIMWNNFAGGTEVSYSSAMPKTGSTTNKVLYAQALGHGAIFHAGYEKSGTIFKEKQEAAVISCVRVFGHVPFAAGTGLTLYGRR